MKLSVWGWLNRVRSRNNPVFDDHAAIVVQRAVRLRHELALDWLWDRGGADVNG